MTARTCAVCGTDTPQNQTWRYYGSVRLSEECPDLLPYACSNECAREIAKRVQLGAWTLPTLKRDPGGYSYTVTAPGKGY